MKTYQFINQLHRSTRDALEVIYIKSGANDIKMLRLRKLRQKGTCKHTWMCTTYPKMRWKSYVVNQGAYHRLRRRSNADYASYVPISRQTEEICTKVGKLRASYSILEEEKQDVRSRH